MDILHIVHQKSHQVFLCPSSPFPVATKTLTDYKKTATLLSPPKEEDESRLKDNERLRLIHSYSAHNSPQPQTNGQICEYIFLEQIKRRGYDACHHLSTPLRFPLSLSLSLPFFCPVVKNETRNCCDVLRNCFLKTMLQNCCAISLYQRIQPVNSIKAAVDLFKTHMLKRRIGGWGGGGVSIQYHGQSRRR